MSKLKALYHKLPEPGNWKVWVLIALVVKSLFVIYFVSLAYSLPADAYGFNWKGSWAKAGGDTPSYFDPIENLLAHGEYYDDHRMPGYGWIYFLLRLGFSEASSFNILIVIQLFFSAISVYLLGLIAQMIFKNKRSFYLVYMLYLLSTFVSIYDYVLMTESLTVSTLIFSFYFFLKYFEHQKQLNLLYSGLFITWAIFLKPIVLPILFLYVVFLSYVLIKMETHKKKIFIRCIIILSPFIIADGIWILRNLQKHKQFYPLQKNIYYAKSNTIQKSIIDFVHAFGGNISFYQKSSQKIYFSTHSEHFYKEGADTLMPLIPQHVYTSEFNIDSLLKIRKKIIALSSVDKHNSNYCKLNNSIIESLDRYTNSIKQEAPFLYYFYSRLYCLRKFVFTSGYGLGYLYKWPKNYYIYKLFKIKHIFFYYLIVLLGIVSSLLLINCFRQKHKNLKKILLLFIIIYLFFVHPLVFKFHLYRYVVLVFPFLILAIPQLFYKVYNLFCISYKNKSIHEKSDSNNTGL